MKKSQKQAVVEASGCHLLVYAGDGTGRPKELLFSSGRVEESKAICDLLLELLRRRAEGK